MAALSNFPLAVLATAFVVLIAGCEGKSNGVPAERVADYIHTVIRADRTTYSIDVVDRLQNVENGIKASEHFRVGERCFPSPSFVLKAAGPAHKRSCGK